MKVSLNTINQYASINLPVDELVERINKQLGKVEAVTDLGERYKGAVIVKIVECEQHPNADRLHVCKVDDGGVVSDVVRDEQGFVQVVCGAPNVHTGMFAVWLPPGATVPASFEEKELFVLDARELRGIVSNGMLASAKELAIGQSHDGILEIDPSEWRPRSTEIKPGASFASAYELDDIVIDIENKMFTHRPDLFGQLGVARELFAITQPAPVTDTHSETRFTEPDWYWQVPQFASADALNLTVFNDTPELSQRFIAVALSGVTVGPSPLWLQTTLVRWGSKPINNVVDLTNYLMLLTAQPTHAYDYDKLRGGTLGVRMAQAGETVKLLNDKTYEVTTDDIVIVDGEGPVGLAGIMGGGDSEVDEHTKNIVLEVANFDMYTVRKTSMRHGLFTDALTRFNKGQSPLQNDRILFRLMELLVQYANARQASNVFDISAVEGGSDKNTVHDAIRFEADFVNTRLGLDLSEHHIANLLRTVNFASYKPEGASDTTLEVTAPFWRTDIEVPEDIVEEVGRLYGFDRLPRVLPGRSIKPAAKNASRERKKAIREVLSRSGANEVLTYSFVHEKTITKAAQDSANAFRLSNALSPDLQYYRLSLVPSLLDKVHMNVKAGHDKFALFELNKVHYKGEMDHQDPGVPNEDQHLGLVVACGDRNRPDGSAYYLARRYLNQVIDLEHEQVVPLSSFDGSHDEWGVQLCAPYEPSRSAVIIREGQVWGVVGEFKQSVRQAFKLPEYTAGFEIDLDVVKSARREYVPLPRFPRVQQDLSLEVSDATRAQDVLGLARETVANLELGDMHHTVSIVDIYQAEGSNVKTLTLRLTLANYERTLKESEVSAVIDDIASAAAKTFEAVKK